MDDLPRAARPALLGNGHQVPGKHLRRIGSSCRRTGSGSTQECRPFGLRGVEQAHAWLSGSGTAVSRTGGRHQRRVWLSRSEMPWLHTHQTVALNIIRRPKATPIHELERYMRCKDCSRLQGRPYKRSHLIALRATKITASDPPSTWWPGER
jgi:hypothetical protein